MTRKPLLTIEEQLKHLKKKGVKFELMDEELAREYLINKNNYFKLTAFRKNYHKHPEGKDKGKYVDLDFAYLVELATIDMLLRYCIIHMALDIEHHAKLKLLNKAEENLEDGYQVVLDYTNSLDEAQKNRFENEIIRNRGNIYCGGIIDKYDGDYPIWAFIEIIPFGRLVAFYGYCANRFSDKSMQEDYFRLKTCKEIRNACAHSNCILNDLRAETITHRTNGDVTKALMSINGMSKNFRKNRMSNARIQQVVTLLYTHKVIVKSPGISWSESQKLQEVIGRAYKHINYFERNKTIKNTLDFLKMVVDSWFSNE